MAACIYNTNSLDALPVLLLKPLLKTSHQFFLLFRANPHLPLLV
jgi:hypothetical protein